MEIAETSKVERKEIVSVTILGTPYKIIFETEKENPKLKGLDGYCDWTTQIISINKSILDDGYLDCVGNLDFEVKKIVRHEIAHAFFMESGMTKYAEDEVLVEWIASQFQKINTAFLKVETC